MSGGKFLRVFPRGGVAYVRVFNYNKYMMRIDYAKQAVKFIATQDKSTKQRIKTAIEGLTASPPLGDIKSLKGYAMPTLRLRVGQYRIIYRYHRDIGEQVILYIADINSRGDIYK